MSKLNTTGDLLSDFIIKMNVSTTLAFYQTSDIMSFLSQAHSWASGLFKWPFVEGTNTTTYVSGTEVYNYPENWKPDSIRLLQVGGKQHDKKTINDYQKFKEDSSSATNRYWADFGLQYFINPSTDASGTITLWGAFLPGAFDPSRTDETTVFSNSDEDGNEAIVYKAMSYAQLREKKFQESQFLEQKAQAVLNQIKERYEDEQYQAQTTQSMYKRFDVLIGETTDELKRRDRWF